MSGFFFCYIHFLARFRIDFSEVEFASAFFCLYGFFSFTAQHFLDYHSKDIYHISNDISFSMMAFFCKKGMVHMRFAPVTMWRVTYLLCTLSFPVARTFPDDNMTVADHSFSVRYADNMLEHRTYVCNFCVVPVICCLHFVPLILQFFDHCILFVIFP